MITKICRQENVEFKMRNVSDIIISNLDLNEFKNIIQRQK